MKNGLIGKDPDAGKDWRQEEKRTTEDEMVGWHHWLDGHKFDHAPDGEEQGSLACYSPLGHRELDMTEQLKWTELNHSPLLKTPLYWGKKKIYCFLFALWIDKTGLIYLLISWMSQFCNFSQFDMVQELKRFKTLQCSIKWTLDWCKNKTDFKRFFYWC